MVEEVEREPQPTEFVQETFCECKRIDTACSQLSPCPLSPPTLLPSSLAPSSQQATLFGIFSDPFSTRASVELRDLTRKL